MLLEAIYHKPYSEYACIENVNTLVVRIRTKKDDVTNVILVYHEKYDPTIKGSELMEKKASDELFDYYEVKVEGSVKRFKYMFYLESRYSIRWFNADGFHASRPEWGFFTYASSLVEDKPHTPEWLSRSVLYQVFPDRFANTGKRAHKDSFTEKALKQHFGGTLEGLTNKLDYICGLGVNGIYLNPIFKSGSYHRYDIEDYYAVDPVFGTEAQLKRFIELCHEKNLKVIFDGVFNHCSSRFFAFKDLIAKGKDSLYRNWFFYHSLPIQSYPKPNYECFAFYGGMPKLNTSNSEVIKYFCEVGAYWIEKFDIDGWRLDVADELNRGFIRKLRETVKRAKKDAVLMGEIWDEASAWLSGDQLDSTMNYPLRSQLNDLLAYRSIDAYVFKCKLSKSMMSLKSSALKHQINIIGTHDTPRFLTLCGEDKRRYALGAVLQFTLPGIPLVYYGDETGMTGDGDPFCRKPMEWDEAEWDLELVNLYKLLIDLRKNHPALSGGEFKLLENKNSNGVFAFMRKTKKDALIIVLNTTDIKIKDLIELGEAGDGIGQLEDLTGHKSVSLDNRQLKVSLKPYQWKLYKTVLAIKPVLV